MVDIFEYRDIVNAILEKEPLQYEEIPPSQAGGYRCFWCEKWTHENEETTHQDYCLYIKLKSLKI